MAACNSESSAVVSAMSRRKKEQKKTKLGKKFPFWRDFLRDKVTPLREQMSPHAGSRGIKNPRLTMSSEDDDLWETAPIAAELLTLSGCF